MPLPLPDPTLQTIVDGNGLRRRGWACTLCEGTGRVHVDHMLPQAQRCDECAGDGWFDAPDEDGEE
jgi:DnaJ-class molecular chaperone